MRSFDNAMAYLEKKDMDHRRKQSNIRTQSAGRHRLPKKNEDKRDAVRRGWELKPSKNSRGSRLWSKNRTLDRSIKQER